MRKPSRAELRMVLSDSLLRAWLGNLYTRKLPTVPSNRSCDLRKWQAVRVPRSQIVRHLLRSAFYVFFLHEQFHHKVESLASVS